jgi:hypothetical protein
METQFVRFAGSAVTVEVEGRRSVKVADFVLQHAPSDGGALPHATFRLLDAADGQLELYRDDKLLYRSDCTAKVAEWLMGEVCRQLADRSGGGLLFHAAGLTRQGQGILVPGGIGAGKSTFAAWLASIGCGYLTDELVYVPHGSDQMLPFVRPLNLKRPARAALENHYDLAGNAPGILSGPTSDLLAPAVLGLGQQRRPTLQLILLPRYDCGGEPSFRRLSAAQAGLALMECLVNARNLPQHGFSEAVRLAQSAPSYKIQYSHFDQIEEPVAGLLQQMSAGYD